MGNKNARWSLPTALVFGLFFWGVFAQGAAEKIKRENDEHLRQLAKQSTYVPSFFSFFFSAFLGFSRQEEFENTREKIEYVSKKVTGEIFFRGGIFLTPFPFNFFCCVG
jgi:hypothetical protein